MISSEPDPLIVKAVFSALLGTCRSIPYAIETESKRLLRAAARQGASGATAAAFKKWEQRTRRERMEPDSLLAFAETARHEDVHEGKHRLHFDFTHVGETNADVADGPPGTSAVVVTAEGVYWLIDQGKPTERREICEPAAFMTGFGITDCPRRHLGRQLPSLSFEQVCRVLVEYYATMTFDAEQILAGLDY